MAFWDWQSRFLPFLRKRAFGTVLVIASAATGALAWSGHPLWLPLSAAFATIWAYAPTRLTAALVAAAYFLAGAHGLLIGMIIFFDQDFTLGILLWFAASLTFVLVHTAFWTRRGRQHRPLRYALILVLMSIPPFGIVGWGSPVPAAGILFAGWGWFGLVVMMAALLALTTKAWPLSAVVLTAFWASAFATWTPPMRPDGWIGLDTSFKTASTEPFADYQQQRKTIALVKHAAQQGLDQSGKRLTRTDSEQNSAQKTKLIVLPESAFGLWSQTQQHLWTHEIADLDLHVLGGATVLDSAGEDNVLMTIAPNDNGASASTPQASIKYRQRMPVPVAMWAPWSKDGTHAYPFANPVVTIGDQRVAVLICYEQLLIWPVLHSMLFDPDIVVAVGNAWWVGNSNVPDIQKASVQAWASLFGKPLVWSVNR